MNLSLKMKESSAAESLTLADILSSPVVTVEPEQNLVNALVLMRSKNISALVVIENAGQDEEHRDRHDQDQPPQQHQGL